EEVVASFTVKRPDAALWELGFEQQACLFEHICQQSGNPPPVVDAADILKNPTGMLCALCARLGTPFSERMLHWPAGSRNSDGVWAKYWYQAVEHSTGFEPYKPREIKLTEFQSRLAEQCQPFYTRLSSHRLTAAA
ncbi:MAG TPA: HAD family hydrolase, partial [Gammaproteobacteria bacterium]|nr:HAD family hydrolase [Gammaproteobacteria bacterium]